MTAPIEQLLKALREIRDRHPATYAHDYADMRSDDWECANNALDNYYKSVDNSI